MDPQSLIALAIPIFFAMIGAELAICWFRGTRCYRFNDAVTDLGCGIGQQATNVFLELIALLVYGWVYEHYALHRGWSSPEVWIAAILGVDFLYYWWHRASHRVNFMWAAHVVHHQSQDYNLAVALRQAWLTTFTAIPFYLPLAIIGIPPEIYLVAHVTNTLYQFWIHTQVIRRLGPLEWVLNTPSHHRVHHGVNPIYIDRNHGGVLIVWDRLFGTFEPEDEPVVYGTVVPYRRWDSVWANFDTWAKLYEESLTFRWIDRAKIWFKPPEWHPSGARVVPEVDAAVFEKWDTDTPAAVQAYVALNFAPAVLGVSVLLAYQTTASPRDLVILAALVILTLWGWAGLLHQRSWALPFEVGRLAALDVVVALYLSGWQLFLGLAVIGLIAAWLVSLMVHLTPVRVAVSRR